jgi:hypothetical protein
MDLKCCRCPTLEIWRVPSYPAVDCVPVEDALAPAVLPLLHQADDVPLLNETNDKAKKPEHQRIFRCTVRVGHQNFIWHVGL